MEDENLQSVNVIGGGNDVAPDSERGRASGDVRHGHKRSGISFHALYNGETTIGFLEKKKIFFTISLAIILAGAISMGVRGLNFGIDFKGGTSWQVPAPGLSVVKAQSVLRHDGVLQPVVYTLGTGRNQSLVAEADLSSLSVSRQQAKEHQVAVDLAKAGGVSYSSVSLTSVGPTWGSAITAKALEALLFFFIGIVLYISLRFEWKMASAAFVAVIHDLLVTVGIYSISNFQITPSTVVALLTILGYSLYDTIVVFDRVQENVKGLVNTGRLTYDGAVDLSLNQVLMRSLNTSLVAIIPVLSVLVIGAYILGATTLQEFGLALFVGLTTGAYSSIGIAAPILAAIKSREPRYRALKARLGNAVAVVSPKDAAQGFTSLDAKLRGVTVGDSTSSRSGVRKSKKTSSKRRS